MAVIATGSKTIIDMSDGKSLSVYLTSSQPKTQIRDVNASTYTPDWSTTSGKLTITPVVYANQKRITLSDSALTITYKRKEGSGNEVELTSSSMSNESISGKVLTVTANKLGSITSGMLTYAAYVSYIDPDTKLTIQAIADITYTLVRTGENAQTVWIVGEQVFKYTNTGAVSPSTITISAHLQNVTVEKWQYRDSNGNWTDYPETSENATITDSTLVISPNHTAIWVGDTATVRVLTSNGAVTDTLSLYKVKDGATGTSAPMVLLTNENITFAGDKDGKVASTTKTSNVVAYKGTTKVTPTVGTISGAPSGMTITKGSATNNEIPLTITVSENATLGGTGTQQGEILIPVTSPVSTTLKLSWSKVNTGATGATGTNAIVFEVWAPNGTVFTNGEGTLSLAARGYDGTTEISSGATYQWYKYASGSYSSISGATSKTYSVSGSDVNGTQTYQCKMTYKSKTFAGTITLEDKVDNYQATIDSTGGDKFVNTVGQSTLTCRLFQNGQEVDTDGSAHTYKWYRLDKDGNALDSSNPFKTGKSISITGDDVDVKTTFVCEVS